MWAKIWQGRRWFLRPIFVCAWLLYLGYTWIMRSERPNQWPWLFWSFLWPVMTAHIGHWTGPYVLPLFPGFLSVAHNLFWDPLLPPTSTQMADLGWWLGLFFGLINLAFQNTTWDVEHNLHPNDDRFADPVTSILAPLDWIAERIVDLYWKIGFVPFMIVAAFTVGTPIAWVKGALWWTTVHHWPPMFPGLYSDVPMSVQGRTDLAYILIVSPALVVGPFVGFMLGGFVPIWVIDALTVLIKGPKKPDRSSPSSPPPDPPQPPPPPKRIRL